MLTIPPSLGVAERLVRVLQGDDQLAGDVLRILRKTALTLEKMGLSQEHELASIASKNSLPSEKSSRRIIPGLIFHSPLCACFTCMQDGR